MTREMLRMLFMSLMEKSCVMKGDPSVRACYIWKKCHLGFMMHLLSLTGNQMNEFFLF